MYKAIKNGKIIAISETDSVFRCLVKDSVEEDKKHTLNDYEQYKGEYLLKSEIPAPTKEEQAEKRSIAYSQEVDPITCHIQRLRDEENPDEDEIAELLKERDKVVQSIKDRYPYPEE